MPSIAGYMYNFSIKDLENLSGVKAHTIRMWEQRYKLLEPKRTDTNIRYYDGNDLKLLLNVSLLIDMGYKISRISSMSEAEMRAIIQEEKPIQSEEKHLLNILKISLLNYDEELFQNVMSKYTSDHSFESAFRNLLVPFMAHIGLLWQTDAICPAQEHFISNLIRQKLFNAIDQCETSVNREHKPFVLYLPEGEIHEIGLLMLHYLIRKKGYRSIFLGTSVPFCDLQQVQQRMGDVKFVSFLTTHPATQDLPKYLAKIVKEFSATSSTFHFSGQVINGTPSPDPALVKLYRSPDEIVADLLS